MYRGLYMTWTEDLLYRCLDSITRSMSHSPFPFGTESGTDLSKPDNSSSREDQLVGAWYPEGLSESWGPQANSTTAEATGQPVHLLHIHVRVNIELDGHGARLQRVRAAGRPSVSSIRQIGLVREGGEVNGNHALPWPRQMAGAFDADIAQAV